MAATHTRNWDETKPADADNANTLGTQGRDTKGDIRERAAVDHYWPTASDEGGEHNKITFREQATNPTLTTDEFAVYTKEVSSTSELFFKDEAGNVFQVTSGGAVTADVLGVTTADLDLLGNTFALRGAESGGTFRELVHVDGSDVINIGDLNNDLWLRATDDDSVYVDDGIAQNKVWHAGNMGTGSTLDADLLDGEEGAAYVGYYSAVYEELESANLSAQNWNTAHSFGAVPRLVQFWIECISTEDGYLVGDRVVLSTEGGGTNNRGIVPWFNDSDVGYSRGLSAVQLFPKTSGVVSSITNSKWKAVFGVWK